jgi:hypothetical protein
MTTTPRKTKTVGKSTAKIQPSGRQRLADGTVRVWSTAGATIPVPDTPYANIRFSFGHERIARSGSQDAIKKTEQLVHDFNEEVLEKRISQYLRMFKRIEGEVEAEDGTVSQRAKAKLKKQKKKGKKK